MPRSGPIAERPRRPAGQRIIARAARGEDPERKLSARVQAQASDQRDAAAARAGPGDSGAGRVSEVAERGESRLSALVIGLGGPLRLPPKPPSFTRGVRPLSSR